MINSYIAEVWLRLRRSSYLQLVRHGWSPSRRRESFREGMVEAR